MNTRSPCSFRCSLVAALLLLPAVACSGSSGSGGAVFPATTDPGTAAAPGRLATGGGRDLGGFPDTGPGAKGDATGKETTHPALGRASEEHANCDGGFCIEGPDGSVCTAECVEDCPEGWACRG